MINWAYHLILEISLLIGLVLLIRPLVRRYLGAHVAYWLWLAPLARCIVWWKIEVPAAVLQATSIGQGEIVYKIIPNPESFIIPSSVPLELIWLTGLLIWVLFRVVSWRYLQVYLRQNSKRLQLPSSLANAVHQKLNANKIQYFTTNCQAAPFVTGLFRPEVYLPEDFFENYSLLQQQCVLAHELTHVRRRDLWMQAVAEIFRALFWFNPVVHIGWRAFREDQEFSCDYQVLNKSNSQERYEYGQVLLKGFHSHLLPATLAFFSQKTERFIMLEKHQNSLVNNIIGITLCLLIGVFMITKAPKAIAQDTSWSEETMHFSFEQIPLSDLVRMVFGFAEKDVVGLDKLASNLVNVEVKAVKPLDAATVLLKCHGFKMKDQGEYYQIEKDFDILSDPEATQVCIELGLNL